MMGFFVINKSSYQIPVNGLSNNRIGTIYPNECYVLRQYEGSIFEIQFRNSSGQIIDGSLRPQDVMPDYLSRTDFMRDTFGWRSGSISVPNIGTLYMYTMRHSQDIIRPLGSYWGTVAAGQPVAILQSAGNTYNGPSRPQYTRIHAVRSTAGIWYAVTGDGLNHGFVNTGLGNRGSMSTSVSFHTSL